MKTLSDLGTRIKNYEAKHPGAFSNVDLENHSITKGLNKTESSY